MIQFILFATIILALWSNSDVKTGKVHNAFLIFPLIFAFILNGHRFISVFVPVFVVLASIYLIIRKRGLLGFADVIAIPFTLMYITFLDLFGTLVFTGVFTYLLIKVMNESYDRKLKRFIRNRIPLMPVLFLSYFVGFLTYLIFLLLF